MADTGDDRIRLSIDGALSTILIGRPEKLNSLDCEMVLALAGGLVSSSAELKSGVAAFRANRPTQF
jgi:enoyl-CoA hydratase/carnithine racemase